MLHKSKLIVESKKVEVPVQTQMTNTKCMIYCAKYNVNGTLNFGGNGTPYFAAVSHLNRPLRKQNFTSTGSKGHGF